MKSTINLLAILAVKTVSNKATVNGTCSGYGDDVITVTIKIMAYCYTTCDVANEYCNIMNTNGPVY